MKEIVFILFSIFLNTPIMFSQINLINTNDSSCFTNDYKVDNNQRSIFLFGSVGIIEVASIGFGYQLTENFSFSIKGSGTLIGSSAMGFPNGGRGIGMRLSYQNPFLFFNNTNVEFTQYLATSFDDHINSISKGHNLDFNIGKETINESGFNFFWAIGFCVSAAKYANILYAPSLKIGYNYNFIKRSK